MVRRKPPGPTQLLSVCPVPNCGKPPKGAMCEGCWPKVSGPTRRALLAAIASERERGMRKSSPATDVLIMRAVAEVNAYAVVTTGAVDVEFPRQS